VKLMSDGQTEVIMNRACRILNRGHYVKLAQLLKSCVRCIAEAE
jgi:hypothetical protein